MCKVTILFLFFMRWGSTFIEKKLLELFCCLYTLLRLGYLGKRIFIQHEYECITSTALMGL